ncbi:MAG: SelB C-terminal domain-containing protein [Fimbriimonas sp.]
MNKIIGMVGTPGSAAFIHSLTGMEASHPAYLEWPDLGRAILADVQGTPAIFSIDVALLAIAPGWDFPSVHEAVRLAEVLPVQELVIAFDDRIRPEELDFARATLVSHAADDLEPVRAALGAAVGRLRPAAELPKAKQVQVFEAEIQIVKQVKRGQTVRLLTQAGETIGTVYPNAKTPTLWQFRLSEPLWIADGEPVVVRRFSPPDLFGGGRAVLADRPPSATVSDHELPTAILALLAGRADGVTTEDICRHTGRTAQALGDVFEALLAEGQVLGFAGTWILPSVFEAASARFLDGLLDLQNRLVSRAYVPADQVAKQAGLKWSGKSLDRMMSSLATQSRVSISEGLVRHPEFILTLTPSQRAFLDRVKLELEKELINVPTAPEIARALGAPVQAVKGVLEVGHHAHELIVLGEGIYFTTSQIDSIHSRLREAARGRPFGAAEARDWLETSRKYIIPILEYFDEKQLAMRVGDLRVIPA